MAFFHSGYWNICHKPISASRKQTSGHSTRSPASGRGGRKSNDSNSHLRAHTSKGSSVLPGKQPSERTHCTASPFLSLSQCRQRGGEALWLRSWPLLPGKEGRGKGRKRTAGEGSSLATPADGRQKCGTPGIARAAIPAPLHVGLSQAQGEPREAAAITKCSGSTSVCRCLTKSHPKVSK